MADGQLVEDERIVFLSLAILTTVQLCCTFVGASSSSNLVRLIPLAIRLQPMRPTKMGHRVGYEVR